MLGVSTYEVLTSYMNLLTCGSVVPFAAKVRDPGPQKQPGNVLLCDPKVGLPFTNFCKDPP